MQIVLQLLVTTVQVGSVYILFALGLTLIFGIMKVVNFVHGHVFAMAALMVGTLVPKFVSAGYPLPLAYLMSAAGGIVLALLLALAVYQFGLRRFLRDLEGGFIFTMGMGLILDGIFLATFGGKVLSVPAIIEGNVSILGATLTSQRLVQCIIAALLTAGLYWLLATTRLGKALRAVAADREAAMLQGIPYKRIALIGFLLASLMAGLAGVLIAPVAVSSQAMGADYLMKSFVAVIVGGLGSVPGAIVGSLFIAVIEAFGSFYFDGTSATIAMFVLVILVLLFRPKGLIAHA